MIELVVVLFILLVLAGALWLRSSIVNNHLEDMIDLMSERLVAGQDREAVWKRQMQKVVNTFEEANKNMNPNARGAALASALAYSQEAQRVTWERDVMYACEAVPGIVTTRHMRARKAVALASDAEAARQGITPAQLFFSSLKPL